jgi:hypothetical protein
MNIALNFTEPMNTTVFSVDPQVRALQLFKLSCPRFTDWLAMLMPASTTGATFFTLRPENLYSYHPIQHNFVNILAASVTYYHALLPPIVQLCQPEAAFGNHACTY